MPTSPGADDNATGVASVLEVARLLGSRPTPRTLQLALFDREELGLLGSRAFVADKKHLENLQGAIVMDMVGFACHQVGCQKYPQGLPVVPPSDKGDGYSKSAYTSLSSTKRYTSYFRQIFFYRICSACCECYHEVVGGAIAWSQRLSHLTLAVSKVRLFLFE